MGLFAVRKLGMGETVIGTKVLLFIVTLSKPKNKEDLRG